MSDPTAGRHCLVTGALGLYLAIAGPSASGMSTSTGGRGYLSFFG